MTKCQNLIRIMMMALVAIITFLPAQAEAGPKDWVWEHLVPEEAKETAEMAEKGVSGVQHFQTFMDSFGWQDIIGGRTQEGVQLTLCLWFGVGGLVLFFLSLSKRPNGYSILVIELILYALARVAGFVWELVFTSLLFPEQCQFWYDLVVPWTAVLGLPAIGLWGYFLYYWWQRGLAKYMVTCFFVKEMATQEPAADSTEVANPSNQAVLMQPGPEASSEAQAPVPQAQSEAAPAEAPAEAAPPVAAPAAPVAAAQPVPVVPVPEYTGPRCTRCGYPLAKAEDHFCGACGYQLITDAPVHVAPPSQSTREERVYRNYLRQL